MRSMDGCYRQIQLKFQHVLRREAYHRYRHAFAVVFYIYLKLYCHPIPFPPSSPLLHCPFPFLPPSLPPSLPLFRPPSPSPPPSPPLPSPTLQLGTLGAGNHYAEIQVVESIYDDLAASRMGVEEIGQV